MIGERTGFLSEAEVAAAIVLPADAPYSIVDCMSGYFSIARHFGAVKHNGYKYIYFPEHDELVRDDVLQLVWKLRRLAKRKASTEAKEAAAVAQRSLL